MLAGEENDDDKGVAKQGHGQAQQCFLHGLVLVELPPDGLQPSDADKPASQQFVFRSCACGRASASKQEREQQAPNIKT